MSAQSGMAGQDFVIVPDAVADAGAYVQQVAESLINGLNSLDHEITSVLDNWTGSAAEAFGTGWTETMEGAADVLDALATMAGLLGVTSRTIAHQDLSNTTNLNSLDLPTLEM
ncbi:WXG100 family type VII secretion target [Nocardia sp. NPDC005366]|uniref:WXG100 family type VII secretion target n=1 Tax=Nocardia sp. NPDC005366 TaxID=3156878 RepID=UPI0033B2546D